MFEIAVWFRGARTRALGCVLLALVLLAAVAFAQETTGSIRGEVTDPSGGVVPNAKVEVSGPGLMRPISATTDSSGAFAFLSLPPGVYSIEVSATGFVTAKRVNIDLQVGRILRIDVKLEVGTMTQTVEVMSAAVILDTSQSTVAANLGANTIDHLPKGRGFDSLIALAPGARYEGKSGGYQVDGASASENIFVIDGMDQTNLYSGSLNGSGNIPFEFVQELQIKSSGFMAEYGGAMGGVINVVTKSGSNDFHGDAGLYLRTDSMQARPRPSLQIDPQDDTKAMYQQNFTDNYRYLSPGGTLGGRIIKDKAWFFAGFYPELTRYERPITFLSNKSSGTFYERNRRDFMNGKIDVSPTSKLHGYAGYIYSPYRRRGRLPARDGSSDPAIDWANRGYREPAASYTFGADYSVTPKLLLSGRGGYNYTNYKDYGIPRGVSVYQNSNAAFPQVPAQWRQTYTGYTPGYGQNALTGKDIQTRFRTNADVSYLFNAAGQHTLKAGYEINRLHKDTTYGSWPDGYIRFYWGSTYTGQAARAGEKMKGTYGYLRHYLYGEMGGASSDNQSLFVQDSWQLHRRVTLNAGLRTEREFVPSFATGKNIPSRAIEFGFGQKLAPRIGVAWDVKGDGKLKLAGSFGLFYDLMKYALPQGSFGGAIYQMWFYPLDNPDPSFYLSKIQRTSDGFAAVAPLKDLPLFEWVDWRIPSNDPSDNTIDPDLKPMRRRVYDFSADYSILPDLVLSARYTHNSVDRVIEDVGTLSAAGEKYYIANPGFGITVAPKTWGPGFPPTPKAKRNYDALELRADKRFSRNYYFSASYTLSRLWGNYSGLASSDENARQDPNVSRYFDLPWMSFDSKGKLVEGRLATDRPHAFKLYGSYTFKNKLGDTTFGPKFFLMSGTPLTTQIEVISSTPVYVNGRGDMGRTPVYSATDMLFTHEFKPSEGTRVKFEANIENLFNQSTITDRNQGLLHPNYGEHLSIVPQEKFFQGFDYKKMLADGIASGALTANPEFGMASGFQGPRMIRLGFKFMF
ncbi:MAG: carboxypeptidase regulatory-like domain-containing protein [Bryobacteraceae bacterium]